MGKYIHSGFDFLHFLLEIVTIGLLFTYLSDLTSDSLNFENLMIQFPLFLSLYQSSFNNFNLENHSLF